MGQDQTKKRLKSKIDHRASHPGTTAVSYPHWDLNLGGYSVKFEVIDGRINHSFSTGYMEERHIEQINKVRRQACDESCPETGFEYFIAGVRHLTGGSRKARKLYMNSLKEWHSYRPFKIYIIYGADRFMRTAANLARPFLPFKVRTAKDLEGAMKLIREEDIGQSGVQAQSGAGVSDKNTALSSKTEHYVEEIMQYLGAINWDIKGLDYDYSLEIGKSHPFRPVFEGLELIKEEHDELLEEQRKAEQRLRKSEDRYRDLVENSRDLICIHDIKGRIMSVNKGASDFLGYSADDLIGSNIKDFLPPGSGTHFEAYLKRIVKQGSSSGSVELMTSSGERRILEFKNSLRTEGVIEPVVRGMAHDITRRTKVETALRESKEKYRLLIENQNDLVVKIDAQGRILFASPSYCKMFGRSDQEIIGKKFMPLVHEDDREMTEKAMEDLYRHPYTCRIEQRAMTKDGWRWLEWSHKAVLDEKNNVVAIVGVGRDITAQKEEELSRKKAEDQLKQAQKMEAIGTLAGGIAHDFNNLLTTITGYADLALKKQISDRFLKDEITEIKKAAEKAASLTSQLLAFSRKQVIKPKILDLNEELEDMGRMLRRMIGEDIDLTALKAEDLWRIKADPGQIAQIIVNLAVNARDAMPDGGNLIIETANAELKEEYFRAHGMEGRCGQYVMLAVSDTGIGMDRKTRSRIFDPFFSTKEPGKGTGLGLSTVYGIVKQNRGYVWAYSEPGLGTVFKVFLPREAAAEKRLERKMAPAVSLEGDDTILVVEDDPMVRGLAVRVLREYGYHVLEAENGKNALDICRKHQGPVHLVLTDVVMPVMNGRELVKQLKPLMPGIRVLFMSGYTDRAIVHNQELKPGLAFIQKPFTPRELLAKVKDRLERKI